MDYVSHYDSPLGGITLAGDGQALTGLWFDGQKYFAATLSGEREERDLPLFQAAARWLAEATGGKANIVVLEGTPGATSGIDRREGFKKVLEECKKAGIR